MAVDFTTLVMSLHNARVKLASTLRSKGVSAADTETLTVLVDKAALVDSTSGLNQIRNGYQLFRNNKTLTRFPEFDTSIFDSMYQICYGCTALESIPALNTPIVNNMMYAFYGCSNLVEIGEMDTSRITSASEMFHGCSKLRKIAKVNFSKVTSQITTTFVSCAALEEIVFEGSIHVDIAMNGCPKLTVASLLSLLNALASGVVSGLTCNIGSKNLAKLTTAQKAIATGKGWSLQ